MTSKKIPKKWTAQELEQLRELYPTHTKREIAEIMGLSVLSINRMAYYMGLKMDKDFVTAMRRRVMLENAATKNLHDKAIAYYLAGGHPRGRAATAAVMLKNKPLIEAKRAQLLFERLAREKGLISDPKRAQKTP